MMPSRFSDGMFAPGSRISRPAEVILLVACLLVVFAYLGMYVLPNNLHDDGLVTALYAKEIVSEQALLDHRPYFVMDASEDGRSYMPISYPQTSHLMTAIFYMIGEETFLKFFSPFCGMLAAAFAYLLLRRISPVSAAVAALLVVLVNLNRFIMVPLIEQPLLATAMMGIYFYYRLLTTRELRYVLLAALFLGLCAAIKQQGLVLLGIILFHGFCLLVYNYVRRRDYWFAKALCLTFVLIVIVAIVPLWDQVDRNGTLDYVPGESRMPFFESRYPPDPVSIELQDSLIDYWPSYASALDVIRIYLLHPLFQMPVWRVNFVTVLASAYMVLLLALAARFLFRRDRILLSILLPILIAEMAMAYKMGTPISQYHVIGLAVWSVLIGIALLQAAGWPSGRKRPLSTINNCLISVTVLILLLSPLVRYYPPWQNSGRYDDYHLSGFMEMGEYVQANTPQDALFLAANEGFHYYSQRDAIWLNEGGGARVPAIFAASDEAEAMYWLGYYGIDYVVIDVRQADREGLYDYIPGTGLMSYIDQSPHFEKVYGAPARSEFLKLYRVL